MGVITSPSPPIIKIEGQLVTNQLIVANHFADFFSKVPRERDDTSASRRRLRPGDEEFVAAVPGLACYALRLCGGFRGSCLGRYLGTGRCDQVRLAEGFRPD